LTGKTDLENVKYFRIWLKVRREMQNATHGFRSENESVFG
jgi:hypothetical protein